MMTTTRRQQVLRGLASRRGLTVIELMVAMAIVVIIIGVGIVTLSNVQRAQLNATSSTLSAMMRYIYNRSVIDHRPYRLVIDMDKGQFWGEALASDDPCAAYLPDPDGESNQKLRAKRSDSPNRKDDEAEALETPKGFAKVADNLLSPRKLPNRILVTGVMTSHHTEFQTQGQVSIHFFPSGYAEKAYVWLGEKVDEGTTETRLTLELKGLMGQVVRHQKVLDERDFGKESL